MSDCGLEFVHWPHIGRERMKLCEANGGYGKPTGLGCGSSWTTTNDLPGIGFNLQLVPELCLRVPTVKRVQEHASDEFILHRKPGKRDAEEEGWTTKRK
jgi:hypothetical protein